ncbi:MAG: hypothetical protein QOH21_870 [Acidobacteriota bacterium]|jgi:uncharacterized RDD family membrane protein YckC|nr:hypothetical protein [Acidobacteriota bacterium]
MLMCRNHVEVIEGIRRCTRCGSTFCRDCLVDIAGHPYCATCKGEQLLDVRSGVDRTKLPLAGFWKRFGAALLDGLLLSVPMYAVMGVVYFTMIAGKQSGTPFWFNFISLPFMFLSPIYEGLMFSLKDGQTLGKMAVGIKVVRPDGSSISTGQAWGRAGLKMILGCMWIIEYIPFWFTEERTTIHDMAASTRVVEKY